MTIDMDDTDIDDLIKWNYLTFRMSAKNYQDMKARHMHASAINYHFFTGQPYSSYGRVAPINHALWPKELQVSPKRVLIWFPAGIRLSEIPPIAVEWDLLTDEQAWDIQIKNMRKKVAQGEQRWRIPWIGEPPAHIALSYDEQLDWLHRVKEKQDHKMSKRQFRKKMELLDKLQQDQ